MALNVGELFATIAIHDDGVASSLDSARRGFVGVGAAAIEASGSELQFEAAQRTSTAASSQLRAAQLRATAARERYNAVLADGEATTARLASAEASMVSADQRAATAAYKASVSVRELAAASDEASVALKGAAVAADSQAGAAFRRVETRVAGLGGSFTGLLKTIIPVQSDFALAGLAVAAIGAVTVDAAAKFQSATKRIQTQAGASAGEVKVLSAGILGMAAAVGTAPVVLADAEYHVASVGQKSLTAAAQLNVLRIAAEGAKIGGADLTDVTNGLDAAVVSGISGVQNYSQAMGALNATVGAGDMTMQDLADALGTGVLAIVKGFGVTLTQASAALAVFGDNNIRGAQAGTDLRMSIQALSQPAKTASASLAQIGLTGADAMNTFADDMQHGGLTAALTDLTSRMQKAGITGAQVGKFIEDAFGKKTSAPLSTLVGEFDRYQQKLVAVDKGAHTFASDWTAYTQTFSYAADAVKAGAEAAATALGEKLLPGATAAMSWIGHDGAHDLGQAGLELERMLGYAGPISPALRTAAVAVGDLIGDLKPLGVVLAAVGFGAVGVAAAVFGETVRLTADGLHLLDDAVSHLKPEILGVGTAFAAVKIAGLLSELPSLAGMFLTVADSAAAAGTSMKTSLLGIGGAGLATAGIGALVGVLGEVYLSERRSDDALNSYLRTLATVDPSKYSSISGITAALVQQSNTLTTFGDNAKTYAAGTSGVAAQLFNTIAQKAAASNSSLIASTDSTESVISRLGATFHLSTSQVLSLANANGISLTHGLQSASDALLPLVNAQKQGATQSGQFAAAEATLGSAMTTTSDKANALSTALGILSGNNISAEQAQDNLTIAIGNMGDSLSKQSHTLVGNSTAAATNRAAVFELISSAEQSAVVYAAAGASVSSQTKAYDANLAAIRRKAAGEGLDAKQIQVLIDKYHATPTEVDTTIRANAGPASAATAAVKAGYGSIPKTVTTTPRLNLTPIRTAMAGLPGSALAAGFATGTALNDGLVSGLSYNIAKTVAAANHTGAAAAAGVKDGAVVKSPSRITHYVGRMLAAGIESGLADGTPSAIAAAQGFGSLVSAKVGGASLTSPAAAGRTTPVAQASARGAGDPRQTALLEQIVKLLGAAPDATGRATGREVRSGLDWVTRRASSSGRITPGGVIR